MKPKLAEPIVGQFYKGPNGTKYKILRVHKNEVLLRDVEDTEDRFTMSIDNFRGMVSWELIERGGKSKKRRKKNKRRTVRSGKIRNFFGF